MIAIGALFIPAAVFLLFAWILLFAEDFLVSFVESFGDIARTVVSFSRRMFGA